MLPFSELKEATMKAVLSASLLAIALAAPASAATIVQNGSFEEDPGVAGSGGNFFSQILNGTGTRNWDIYSSLPGWTSDQNEIEVQTAGTVGLTPYDGNFYVELDANRNTSITQNLLLDVGRYILSFAYSPRVNSPTTNAISFGINGLFADEVNGPGNGTAIGQWTVVTREFLISTAGTYTLFFDATTMSDSFGGFIDGVSVAPVPVPAAGGLLAAGLFGLAALKRRRKSA